MCSLTDYRKVEEPMIKLPLGVKFVDVAALAYLMMPGCDSPPEVCIDVWDADGPLPDMVDTDWLSRAILVTQDLIEAIENNAGDVEFSSGIDPHDLYYLYCALVDGLDAVERQFSSVETVEDAAYTFDCVVNQLVERGLFVPVVPTVSQEPLVDDQ